MRGKFELHDEAERQSNANLRVVRNEDSSLEDFEARLQDLNDRLRDLNVDTRVVRLENRPYIFDAVLDLRVKADAVRWMLRVAKHLSEPARDRVVLTVKNSLEQLEKAVDLELHAA